MENGGGIKESAEKSPSRSRHVGEEFSLSSGWTEDSNSHFLLIDIPGFKKEDVKLELNNLAGAIRISGQREATENRYLKFEKSFKVPENSDFSKITKQFDGNILSITIPKQFSEDDQKIKTKMKNENMHCKVEEDVQKTQNNVKEQEDKRENDEKLDERESVFRSAMKLVRENTRIVVVVVLAFSLGIFISRGKFKNI